MWHKESNISAREPLSSCSCVNVSNYRRRTTLVGVTPCASYCCVVLKMICIFLVESISWPCRLQLFFPLSYNDGAAGHGQQPEGQLLPVPEAGMPGRRGHPAAQAATVAAVSEWQGGVLLLLPSQEAQVEQDHFGPPAKEGLRALLLLLQDPPCKRGARRGCLPEHRLLVAVGAARALRPVGGR